MELPAQAMTDVFTHDGEAAPVSFGNDRFSNRTDAASRLERIDGQVKTIERALRHGSFLVGNFTNQEGFALVAALRGESV